ncbi:MAG: energy transducer TonB, partial [Myxococcales bacterium]|nr:energy transducer TonB [Myxococcales bacterium]
PPDAPADEPPPPAPETPVDFGNVTLSNTDGDSSWKIAPSTGKEMTGPIGTPGAAVTGRSRDGVVGGVVGGTNPDPVVPAGDLRRRPVPPSASLESLLKRNFPRDARRQGIEGTARIRVRLSRDGSVRVLRRLDESYPGFGQACATTLSQSPRWSPGIDRSGNPATTEFNFTCRFQME